MAETNDIQVTSPPSASLEAGLQPASPPVSNDEDDFFGEEVKPVKPADTKPAPVVPPVEKQTPKHSSRTLREARDLGLDDNYAQSLSTDALEEVVYHLNRQARHKPAEKPVAPVEEPIDWGTDGEGKALTEKDYAPAVVRLVKQQHAKDKELNELKEEIKTTRQREAASQVDRNSAVIDSAFAALGAGYEKHFGKEPGSSLAADKPEMKKRIAILRAAGITLATVDPAKINGQVKEAVELFGLSPEEEPEVAAKKDRWNRGGLAIPTARDRKEVMGEDGAKKAVASLLRKKGFDTVATDDDEESASIPD